MAPGVTALVAAVSSACVCGVVFMLALVSRRYARLRARYNKILAAADLPAGPSSEPAVRGVDAADVRDAAGRGSPRVATPLRVVRVSKGSADRRASVDALPDGL